MVDVSRRAVLGGGIGVLSLLAIGVVPSAAIATRESAPLRSHYESSVGEIFIASHDGRTAQVRLTHIRDVSHTSATQRPHAFILFFTPVGTKHLRDDIYTLRRRGVPTHTLLLSSVGSEGGMQSLINRSA